MGSTLWHRPWNGANVDDDAPSPGRIRRSPATAGCRNSARVCGWCPPRQAASTRFVGLRATGGRAAIELPGHAGNSRRAEQISCGWPTLPKSTGRTSARKYPPVASRPNRHPRLHLLQHRQDLLDRVPILAHGNPPFPQDSLPTKPHAGVGPKFLMHLNALTCSCRFRIAQFQRRMRSNACAAAAAANSRPAPCAAGCLRRTNSRLRSACSRSPRRTDQGLTTLNSLAALAK
jgi:hypothetical protein